MSAILGLPEAFSRLYKTFYPPRPPKKDNALRMGVLGAARITPIAIINPALTHPDLVVEGVAARDLKRAQEFAKKHGIKRVFGDYQEMIDDPAIDVVYNPLPNGLHHQWTLKAIQAGKHVLLEKPSASNEKEAKEIWDMAKQKNVIVLEAWHYRNHPALHEYAYQLYSLMTPMNPLVEVEANFKFPIRIFGEDDIRHNFDLAGGVLMDMGCYPLSAALYSCRACAGTENREGWENMIEVESAKARIFEPTKKELKAKKAHCDSQGKPAIDSAIETVFTVPTAGRHRVKCTVNCDSHYTKPVPLLGMKRPAALLPDISVKGIFKDGSSVHYYNFPAPSLYHSITTTLTGQSAEKAGVKSGTKRYSHAYVPDPKHAQEEQMRKAAKDGFWPAGKGQPYWTTYRWMLEAFVEGVREAQRGVPAHEARGTVWVTPKESVTFMRMIDAIYTKAGLPIRG